MRRAFFICGRHVENKYVQDMQGVIGQGKPARGGGPRSHPNHTMGGTATDSADLRISHENPVFTTNRRGLARRYSRHSRGLRAAPRPWRGQIHQRRTCSSKIWKLAKAPTRLRNTPSFGAIAAATDIAVIDIAVFEIKDLNRQASANGTLRLRPPSGKSGAPLPWCSWRPAVQDTGLTSPNPNAPEPRFLDIFQDYMLADDDKGPDAQRPVRRGSS